MILFLLACGSPTPPPLDLAPMTEDAPQSPVAERVAPPALHGAALIDAQDAWVASDTSAMRAALARLAAEPLPGAAEVAAPYRAAVQAAAAAADVDGLRVGLAGVMAACGACHVASDHLVIADPVGLTEEETDVASFMRRHVWSVDRLREGLVGPNDVAWTVGAEALHEEGLDPEDVPDRRGAALASRLHSLAGVARARHPRARPRRGRRALTVRRRGAPDPGACFGPNRRIDRQPEVDEPRWSR